MPSELDNLDVSKYLLWIVPGYENEITGLEEKVYGSIYEIGNRDHRTFCKYFVERYFLDKNVLGESHTDYARKFNKEGMIIGFNSGVKIDGLYACSLFLPEHLSAYQQMVLNGQMKIFESKFHQKETMFSTVIYASEPIKYNGPVKGYRDLGIEAIINNNPNKNNGYILLNEYLDSLKNKREL